MEGHSTPASGDASINTTASSNDPAVQQERFNLVEVKFRRLCQELHLPFLEVKLYEKYILTQRTSENLYRLCVITKILSEHKKRTMRVLQLIQRREVIVICIFALTNDYTKGRIATLELQEKVVRLIHSLQKISLKVVEAVDEWRSQLTRPFPFMFRRLNCILKMAADNHLMSASPLSQILPLRLYDFPLCSHLPSLAVFTEEVRSLSGAIPQIESAPTFSSKYQARLRRAEVYIRNELHQQQSLVKELQLLCEKGLFLPLINTPVIPGCKTGISFRSAIWAQKLQKSLSKIMSSLSVPTDTTYPEYLSYADIYDQDPYAENAEGDDESEDEREPEPQYQDEDAQPISDAELE